MRSGVRIVVVSCVMLALGGAFGVSAAGRLPSNIPVTVTLADAGSYDAVVTTPCGALTSAAATLTVICPADYDGNGRIEPADVNAFVNVWFTSLQQSSLGGDYDGNGRIEPADINAFVNAWFAALSGGGC